MLTTLPRVAEILATPADATRPLYPMIVAAQLATRQYIGCIFNRGIEVSYAASPPHSCHGIRYSCDRLWLM